MPGHLPACFDHVKAWLMQTCARGAVGRAGQQDGVLSACACGSSTCASAAAPGCACALFSAVPIGSHGCCYRICSCSTGQGEACPLRAHCHVLIAILRTPHRLEHLARQGGWPLAAHTCKDFCTSDSQGQSQHGSAVSLYGLEVSAT